MKTTKVILLLVTIIGGILTSCGGSDEKSSNSKPAEPIFTPKPKVSQFGVGPIKGDVKLDALDPKLAEEGEAVFTQMCTACHKMDKRHVGPALGDVIKRRNPAWIMNMILNPENMVKEDPIAKNLLAEYLSPMANQNLTEEQARAVLEYFRKYSDENK